MGAKTMMLRSRMVHALVRWGGEERAELAEKNDGEIRSMVDDLKMRLVVDDPAQRDDCDRED